MLRIDLNAGCGAHHPAGWVNADISDVCQPDVLGDLVSLPFAAGTVGRIFASHVLEHQPYRGGLPVMLAEFRRVLAADGELCVVGPDIERAVVLRESHEILELIIAWPAVFGSWPVKTPPEGHAWTATGPLTEDALTVAGFGFECFSGRLRELSAAGGRWRHRTLTGSWPMCAGRMRRDAHLQRDHGDVDAA